MTRAVAIAFCLAVSLPVWAQQPAGQNSERAAETDVAALLLLRREYVPEASLEQVAKGLIPVRREEFETLLEKAKSRDAFAPPDAWVTRASYEATLTDNVLSGTTRLEVSSRSQAKVLLALPQFRLGIEQAQWEGDPSLPAVAGVGRDGVLRILTPRSGTLVFRWKLLGRKDPWGAVIFDLPLVESSQSTLQCSLPEKWQLDSSIGSPVALNSSDKVAGFQLDLGTQTEVRLRCTPPSAEATGAIVLVAEQSQSSVSLGEIAVECQLRLDIHRQSLGELEVELVGDWRPTTIRQGDRQVPFEIRGNTAHLQFDPPLFGPNRRILISGFGQLVEGGRYVAPRGKVKQGTWMEGTISVQANQVLLDQWELKDVVRAARPLNALTAQQWTLRDEDASVAFRMGRVTPHLRVECGTTVRLDPDSATANIIADFSSEAASSYELNAIVAPEWIVDSVEAESHPSRTAEQSEASWIADWAFIREVGQLQVTLQRGLVPQKMVRLSIVAHRAPPKPGEAIPADQLRPLRWSVDQYSGVFALGVASGLQVTLQGLPHQPSLSAAMLTESESSRLQLADDLLLLRDDEVFDAGRFVLAQENPRFTAAWKVRVSGQAGALHQQIEGRIEPRSSLVERLHVLLRPGVGRDVLWDLPGEEGPGLSAERVRAAEGTESEEEWEITLARVRRNPFRLRATIKGEAIEGSWRICLPRSLEAASQTGTVAIERGATSRWKVEQANGLSRTWNKTDEDLISSWSYDPAQNASLVLRNATPLELQQLLLISQANLETRLSEAESIHKAAYVIDCEVEQTITFRLPASGELDQVLLENKHAQFRTSAGGSLLHVVIPRSSNSMSLQIVFRTPLSESASTVLVKPPWPSSSVPIIRQTWRVVYPKSYRQLTFRSSPEAWTLAGLWQRFGATGESFDRQADTTVEPECSHAQFIDASGIPGSVWLVRRQSLVAWGWVTFVLSWICISAGAARFKEFAWRVGMLGLMALSLPESVDPLGRMILLGLLAALVTRRWKLLSARPIRAPVADGPRVSLASHLVAILVFTCIAGNISADDRAAKNVIHRVVIPRDKDDQPTEYVYMSSELFRELHARSERPATSGPDYLMLQGDYQARPRGDGTAWDSIKAKLVLEVLQGPAIIPITWRREGFLLPSDQIKLDGRATAVSWNELATEFSIKVETTGRHVLEFTAQPTARENASRCVLRFPAAGRSVLSIDELDQANPVQPTPELIENRNPLAPGIRSFELSQRTEVTLHTRPRSTALPVSTGEQLLWLDQRTGAMIVEGRWRFSSNDNDLLSAAVDFDGPFELLTAAALSPASVQWQTREKGARLTWVPREPTGEMVVEASLLWKGTDEDRSLLPRIEPAGVEVTRRWLAIDTDVPDEIPKISPEDALDVVDFAELWNSEEPPTFAWSVAEPGPVPLATAPARTDVSYAASTLCQIGPNRTTWHYRAQFKSTVDGPLLLAIPGESSIRSVRVERQGKPDTAEWLALQGDLIAIHTTPLKAGDEIYVEGVLPAAPTRTFVPPALQKAMVQDHKLELHRRPNVVVQITEEDGLQPEPLTVRELSDEFEKVASYRTTAVGGKVTWSAQSNRPRTVALLATTLRREGNAWVARLDGLIAVREGVVSEFRLDSARHWSAPKLITGDATIEAGQGEEPSRHWIIRPAGGAHARFQFACESLLEGSAPGRVQVPAFQLLDAENVQQYLRLPSGAELNWQLSGLQESPLPSSLALTNDPILTDFRIASPFFAAELVGTETPKQAPRVVWHNIQVIAENDEKPPRHLTIAEMAVDPAGETKLPLLMPTGAQLMRAEVEGEAAIADLQGTRGIAVDLRSSTLPQVVRLIFSASGIKHEDLNVKVLPPWKLDPLSLGEASTHPRLNSAEVAALLEAILERNPGEAKSDWAQTWLHRFEQAPSQEIGDTSAVLKRLEDQAAGEQQVSEPRWSLDVAESLPVQNSKSTLVRWLVTLAAWGGLVAAVARIPPRWRSQDIQRRWSSFLAALVAIFIALIASPVLGGLLLIVAALSAILPPWQRTE